MSIAKEEGYKALSLTEHDTVSRVPGFMDAYQKAGMECVLGVEFTCSGLCEDFHLTTFDCKYNRLILMFSTLEDNFKTIKKRIHC